MHRSHHFDAGFGCHALPAEGDHLGHFSAFSAGRRGLYIAHRVLIATDIVSAGRVFYTVFTGISAIMSRVCRVEVENRRVKIWMDRLQAPQKVTTSSAGSFLATLSGRHASCDWLRSSSSCRPTMTAAVPQRGSY